MCHFYLEIHQNVFGVQLCSHLLGQLTALPEPLAGLMMTKKQEREGEGRERKARER